ncbi:hypothetical protein PGT21_026159 [Puccinia graminis f. sp. tritici]|uniref:Cms1 ribosomal small subunit n=1 Tax=Puccinia graminis f. sp. tritici TaxID=56615 RepID=A0A5B0M5C5_PUCGR|nr:hypothetical protein PGTUg99_028053 [Puccinia graminis f. sp. tritici]KAA1072025.1 hypothetical protein PGT21_026159 [Puccinia graminis f. sp. tritici]KAA1085186.1 hypothetical protein PGTUg99_014755 [Puccinia graminis f. sp. tritici]
MPPTKSTKATVSADALEDTQFSINGTAPQDDGHSENEPPKKKRKKANQKAKKTKKATDPPSTQNDAEAAQDEDSAAQANDDDTTKEDLKSPVKPGVTPSSSSKLTPAAIAELKRRKKEKAKTKQKLRKEKAIQLKGVKEEQCLHIHPACESTNESSSIGLQPPDLQINYLKDRQKRALPLLSDLEFESLPLEKSWLVDVSDKPLRGHLGAWLETGAVPGLLEAVKETPDKVGAPVALVISSSALRAVDLCREVKRLIANPKESGEITKLFAKHFKLPEHVNHLKETKVSIGVGTPDRISKLLTYKDDEGLKLDRLKFLILDLTWLDAKGFNLTELPDSTHKAALWKSLLGLPKTLERFQSGKTKIVLF